MCWLLCDKRHVLFVFVVYKMIFGMLCMPFVVCIVLFVGYCLLCAVVGSELVIACCVLFVSLCCLLCVACFLLHVFVV